MNKKTLTIAGLILLLGLGTVASANHAWGRYHWDISTDQSLVSPLQINDNLTTAQWKGSLAVASSDWNQSVLKNKIATSSTFNANCDPTLGQVEVCNSEYGDNGWLGIAQIWAYRGRNAHIAQGLVKLNDTYFNTSQYDAQAWRDYVTCQEVGHTLGLDHQDEAFSNTNLGTCMDYTNDPDGSIDSQSSNEHPNTHDYDMMTEIYAHLNSTDEDSGGPGNGKGKKPKKAGNGVDVNLNDPSAWGKATKQDAQGNNSRYERDLGNGQVLITHVIWVK